MMDGQQRDFESWAEKNGFTDFEWRDGWYSSPATSCAWQAWQHWTRPQTNCQDGDCQYYGQKRPSTCDCASRPAPTRSQALAAAGYTRRPSLRAMEMRAALELIAAPMRPDGTWNRDRDACRELAAEALGRYDDDQKQTNVVLSGAGTAAGDAQ